MPPKAKADQTIYTKWLMKAEPETRMEKGKDVAFSVDHFEAAGTTSWEGVRNHQAKNFMKNDQKIGHKVLFYHSNCKVPGVAAIAEICKEGYPDNSAWDADHPYFDARSNEDSPTWYMTDLKFISKLSHFVPLKLLQSLKEAPDNRPEYLSEQEVQAISQMALLSRGRLSVSPVSEEAYNAIVRLGEKGGFDDFIAKKAKKAAAAAKRKKGPSDEDAERTDQAADAEEEVIKPSASKSRRKG